MNTNKGAACYNGNGIWTPQHTKYYSNGNWSPATPLNATYG